MTPSPWINFSALWKILVVGLLCGAGLPALFAIGLRTLALPKAGSAAPSPDTDAVVGGNPVAIAVASISFAVVLAAIGWGIYLIVSSS
jgi:hypothetical protein